MSDSTGEKKRRNDPRSESEPHLTETERYKLGIRGYTLNRKLSEGVSAKIYLATLRRPDKPDVVMACKLIDKQKAEPKFITKFLPREIAILSQITHPHVVQVYSILEIRNKCFVFMRFAEYGDLLDYLSNHGPTEETHARMWMRQLLLALKFLHHKAIAHRDIKCENVLITQNLNAKLADFGFARTWTDDQGREQLSETFCGSLSYAAPEILMGRPYCPKYCDIWSLGVVFFVMVNMAKPFTKNKAGALLQLQLEKAYTFRPRADRILGESGKDVIKRMLEPDVHLRATAESLLRIKWMVEDPLLLKLVPDVQ